MSVITDKCEMEVAVHAAKECCSCPNRACGKTLALGLQRGCHDMNSLRLYWQYPFIKLRDYRREARARRKHRLRQMRKRQCPPTP